MFYYYLLLFIILINSISFFIYLFDLYYIIAFLQLIDISIINLINL